MITSGDLQSPEIKLEGTEGQTGYYRSDIKVTITDKVSQEETRAVKILVVQNGKETQIDGRTYTYTIKDEGEYELRAYMIDNKGNKSEVSDLKTFCVDKTEPSTVSIKATTINYTDIQTEATGKDDLSGIYSYEFQRSLTGRDDYFQTVKTPVSSRGTESCSYTSLLQGRTYYLRVKVTDKAGNYKYGMTSAVTKLEAPSITIVDPNTWTNLGKEVTMVAKSGYTIKYTTDGKTNPSAAVGETYTGKIRLTDNCTIRAVYISSENKVGEIGTNKIEKIDKNIPLEPTIRVDAKKTTVTLRVTSADDAVATNTDGKSGVEKYNYILMYNQNSYETGWVDVNHTVHTFDRIYGFLLGVDCEYIVRVKDSAGNVQSVSGTTKTCGFDTSIIVTTPGAELATIRRLRNPKR